MPINADIQAKIDHIRNVLYGGGFPNPVNNAEQLSYLFFFYLAEQLDENNQDIAQISGQPYTSFFAGENEKFRWNVWTLKKGQDLVNFTRDSVFPFYAKIARDSHMDFMAQARLQIDDPAILSTILHKVGDLKLENQDPDTKGDLFEYILKQISASGELGQFRTPRHIIRAMVKMLNPKKTETIYDPACGTAGFLSEAYQHILLQNSDPQTITTTDADGKQIQRGNGDMLTINERNILINRAFMGTDVDSTMVRLASMNMMLRGLANAKIIKVNPLTTTIDRAYRHDNGMPADGVDVILANPPFAGRVDSDSIAKSVQVAKTKATEILFLKYMLNQLKQGGRCATIIPDGVLFSGSTAHREIRQKILTENTLNAVMSLPAGAFQPYSGVKCSVLFFTRGGTTQTVQFLDVQNDGYKLDTNHTAPIDDDDLPHALENFQNHAQCLTNFNNRNPNERWTKKYWFANATEITENEYSLNPTTYQPKFYEQVEYDPPADLLAELGDLDAKIQENMDKLRGILWCQLTLK